VRGSGLSGSGSGFGSGSSLPPLPSPPPGGSRGLSGSAYLRGDIGVFGSSRPP
jgi:hypothetical protein